MVEFGRWWTVWDRSWCGRWLIYTVNCCAWRGVAYPTNEIICGWQSHALGELHDGFLLSGPGEVVMVPCRWLVTGFNNSLLRWYGWSDVSDLLWWVYLKLLVRLWSYSYVKDGTLEFCCVVFAVMGDLRLVWVLTFWNRNFFNFFSTPCIWNANNKGTKKGSVLK
jgi:hypothetical protein